MVSGGAPLNEHFVSAEISFRKLQDALKQIEEGIEYFRNLEEKAVGHDGLTTVQDLRQEVGLLMQALCRVNDTSRTSGCKVFAQGESRSSVVD